MFCSVLLVLKLFIWLSSIPPSISSKTSEKSTCHHHTINFEVPPEESVNPPSQHLLFINQQMPLRGSFPTTHPSAPQCVARSPDRPAVLKTHAQAKIQKYCAKVTRSVGYSGVRNGSHVSLAYATEPDDLDRSSELWFSIAWNPKCGHGKTRIVQSRCEAHLNSILEGCDVDSDIKWGGQVFDTCLVYGMSSNYGKSCEHLDVLVGGTIMAPMDLLSADPRSWIALGRWWWRCTKFWESWSNVKRCRDLYDEFVRGLGNTTSVLRKLVMTWTASLFILAAFHGSGTRRDVRSKIKWCLNAED